MQASQWTTDIIVITTVLAVASALLGYFVAALRQGRQLSQLTAQLEQSHTAQASVIAEKAALTEQLKVAEGRGHELQVAESKLNAQLQSAIENADAVLTSNSRAGTSLLLVQLKLKMQVGSIGEVAGASILSRLRGGHSRSGSPICVINVWKAQTSNDQLQADRDRPAMNGQRGQRPSLGGLSERDVREQLSEAKQALTERAQVLNALQERFGGLSSEHTELKTTCKSAKSTSRSKCFSWLIPKIADSGIRKSG